MGETRLGTLVQRAQNRTMRVLLHCEENNENENNCHDVVKVNR